MSAIVDLARGVAATLAPSPHADLDIESRAALVTGAGDGIGLHIARELDRRGARVAVLDLDGDAATRAAASLAQGVPLAVDVRDRTAMAAAVNSVVERFGQLDIVVANAGIPPVPATIRTVHPAAFDRVIDVNLTGAFNTVHPAMEPVIAARGHVVVVASVAAFVPGPGSAPYMISKAAVEQLGRSLRVELAPHGATATTSYFGVVQTEMTRVTLDEHPLGRRMAGRLPGPLGARVSPEQAGRVVVDGIAARAPRTVAPRAWSSWMLSRGVANLAVDRLVSRDPGIQDLIVELERRQLPPRRPDRPAAPLAGPSVS